MANGSSSTFRVIGVALLVVGVGLAFWGYQLSDTVGSKLSHALTGSYSNKVMTCYISGAACFVVGLFLTLKK